MEGAVDRSAEDFLGYWRQVIAQLEDLRTQTSFLHPEPDAEDSVPEDPEHMVEVIERCVDPAQYVGSVVSVAPPCTVSPAAKIRWMTLS